MTKSFFIREKGKYVKIDFCDIIYIEACGNYLRIVTRAKKYLVLIAMKRMELLLPPDLFTRIHKSYIVSLEHISEFDRNSVYLRDWKLPIGNQYRGSVDRSVMIIQEDNFHEPAVVPIHFLNQKVNAG
jgi:DNA-binding LytR/AlgR family response regulator